MSIRFPPICESTIAANASAILPVAQAKRDAPEVRRQPWHLWLTTMVNADRQHEWRARLTPWIKTLRPTSKEAELGLINESPGFAIRPDKPPTTDRSPTNTKILGLQQPRCGGVGTELVFKLRGLNAAARCCRSNLGPPKAKDKIPVQERPLP